MRAFLKRTSVSALVLLFLGVPPSFGADDLIAPTRSLEGPAEPLRRLTVVSEPLLCELFIDGSNIGQTPVWLEEGKSCSGPTRA